MGRFVDALSARLSQEQPAKLAPKKSAAVAVIFRDTQDDEEVLLIRRAERKDDAWSGQVAFPGGMVSPSDGSFEETARREAMEEVAIDLSPGKAAFVGYMREVRTKTRNILVVPCVFRLSSRQELVPNSEVASLEWASLSELAGEEAKASYMIPRTGGEVPFPCIVHRGLVIWGLTERILSSIVRA